MPPPAGAPPVAPPGVDPAPRQLWTRFRALPIGVQAVLWVLCWPALGALLLVSGRDVPRWRYALAPVTLVVGGALWISSGVWGGDPGPVEVAPAAEDRVGAAEAEARAAEVAAGQARTWAVTHVVDGDTIDVRAADGTEERVRIVGIDTPERGECGFGEASSAMSRLVLGEQVELVAGARDDRDRYGRILRYVDVGGVDAGLSLIQQGLAIARYDSRDGYGRHDREAAYVATDQATEAVCATAPAASTGPAGGAGSGPGSGPGGAWRNCTEAREHGAAPVLRGDPGYGGHLDGDGDGIGCE
jgi:endonuclease YncB( thermonuclease family)